MPTQTLQTQCADTNTADAILQVLRYGWQKWKVWFHCMKLLLVICWQQAWYTGNRHISPTHFCTLSRSAHCHWLQQFGQPFSPATLLFFAMPSALCIHSIISFAAWQQEDQMIGLCCSLSLHTRMLALHTVCECPSVFCNVFITFSSTASSALQHNSRVTKQWVGAVIQFAHSNACTSDCVCVRIHRHSVQAQATSRYRGSCCDA